MPRSLAAPCLGRGARAPTALTTQREKKMMFKKKETHLKKVWRAGSPCACRWPFVVAADFFFFLFLLVRNGRRQRKNRASAGPLSAPFFLVTKGMAKLRCPMRLSFSLCCHRNRGWPPSREHKTKAGRVLCPAAFRFAESDPGTAACAHRIWPVPAGYLEKKRRKKEERHNNNAACPCAFPLRRTVSIPSTRRLCRPEVIERSTAPPNRCLEKSSTGPTPEGRLWPSRGFTNKAAGLGRRPAASPTAARRGSRSRAFCPLRCWPRLRAGPTTARLARACWRRAISHRPLPAKPPDGAPGWRSRCAKSPRTATPKGWRGRDGAPAHRADRTFALVTRASTPRQALAD